MIRHFIPVLTVLMLMLPAGMQAQSKIKDGTVSGSSAIPGENAVLELESAKRGLLLPRVSLTALDATSPLSAHIAGMTVYNTATSGTGSNAVSPGYYYNDGTQWVRLAPGYKEPWNVSGTANPADSNQQNIYQMGKVAIGTTGIPTASLDINGNVRVRDIPVSISTKDVVLVTDTNGYVKLRLSDRMGSMAGYLTADFSSGPVNSTIYKLTGIKDLYDPANDFDSATALFKAPVTGIYRLGMTLTAVPTGSGSAASNYVYGFASASDDQWVVRFTMPDSYIEESGSDSPSGATNSFRGVVKLQAGQSYYFGIGFNTKVLAYPSGNTGTGIGTYFEIKLLDN